MNLFTYGTLMDPAVWSRVAWQECECRRAVLIDYEARRLCGFSFPGLVNAPGTSTPGLVYLAVCAEALARLDAYEDDFYTRVPLPVKLEDGTIMNAQVYLMAPGHENIVLPEIWMPPP